MERKVVILANDTTYTYNLRGAIIKALIKEKYKVYIVAQVLNFKEELENMGCKIIDMSIGRHGTNPFSDLKLLKEYKKILKNIQPDVVLSYNIKPNVYGGMACAKYNIRFMPNITGLGTALEYPGLIQILTKALYKIGLRKANTIFFQNTENEDFFKKNKLLSNKTKTILLPGSGVDLNEHKALDYPKDDGIVRFLFIARIMKDKGIDIYLETAKKIKEKYPNTEFHICGYCDDENYKQILDKYEKDNIIIYHGEQKNMIPFFEMAHCIVHPSYYPEGMSNVLLEAAAHGRPIICTDRSGCRETVYDNETGYVAPIKNTRKVIECVEKIIKMSNKERKQMGLNGRKKIEKEFDRQIVVEKYFENITTKNKIAYIGGFELPDKNAAANRVISNYKIFKKIGYDTIFLGITKDNRTLKQKDLEYESYPIKYPKNTIQWFHYLLSAKYYIDILKKEKNIKIVILYNCPSVISLKILKFCRKNNIKCVGDITEWYHVKTKNIIYNFLKNFDSNFRMKIVNKKMDGLILISSFLYSYYKNISKKILVPPLIDIDDKKWDSVNNKNNNEKNIKLLYNGDPGKKDRIDKIINLLSRSKINYSFDIVGITKNEFLKLYDFDEESILKLRIDFHGRVPYFESLRYLKECDALIFFRDDTIVSKAGFSTKFVEATACGVPVITNLTSDINNYLKNDFNGIVLEDNLIDNINIINKITKSKLKKIKSNINKSEFDIKKYEDIIDEWLKKI